MTDNDGRTIDPGRLFYRSLDGLAYHYPGPDPWLLGGASGTSDLDLLNLRALCVQTLQKVEDELERRGLLGRLTPSGRVVP